MEYIIIHAGLGNQMSQYAFYLAKKERNPRCRMIIFDNAKHHNGYELSRVFKVRYRMTLFDQLVKIIYILGYRIKTFKHFFNLVGIKIYNEAFNVDYTPEMLECHNEGLNLFVGVWHSEKYFITHKEEIRKAFTFLPIQQGSENDMLSRTIANTNSVSIHVRRGDYLQHPEFSGITTEEYYKKAVDYIYGHITSPHFFVFSNDIEWCKRNLDLVNATYVNCNHGRESWRDIQLMSLCKHHIIANSSFSWWGAWLAEYKEGITIRPKGFLKDVETKDFYPERWIHLEY